MTGLRRRRPAPTGRRAVLIAVLLSILLPGLGHVYVNHLLRALIWFGGTIAVGVVLSRGPDDPVRAVALGGVLGALAALDAALVIWLEARSPSHR